MTNVVVSGYGAITPLGRGAQQLWEGLNAQESGIGTLEDERFSAAGLGTAVAAADRVLNMRTAHTQASMRTGRPLGSGVGINNYCGSR